MYVDVLHTQIEVLVYCLLTIRQRYLYDAIKRKIRIEDLLAGVSHAAAASNASSSLMNLVMQFRKVCFMYISINFYSDMVLSNIMIKSINTNTI